MSGLWNPLWLRDGSCLRVVGILSGVSVLAVVGVLAGNVRHSEAAPPADPPRFRMGVSYASFGMVSPNDASAALKVWASTLAKERNLKLNVQVGLFEQESQLRRALDGNQLEAASMSAEEFLRSGQMPDGIFLAAKNATGMERYVVVVHRGSGIDDLAGLKGRRLLHHISPMTGPALPWFEILLARQEMGRAEAVLGKLTTIDNPSKAVLRVFFRQDDACLVTTNAFGLACELNPQLRKDLKVLATSPELISNLVFFHPRYTGAARLQMEAAFLDLHSTPVGQQVLTIFQGSRMVKLPLSRLESTRQLLAAFERLKGGLGVEAAPVSQPQAALLHSP